MVVRFASAELKKEALANEDIRAHQSLLGRCGCLLGACLVLLGIVAQLPGSAWRSGKLPPVPEGSPAGARASAPQPLQPSLQPLAEPRLDRLDRLDDGYGSVPGTSSFGLGNLANAGSTGGIQDLSGFGAFGGLDFKPGTPALDEGSRLGLDTSLLTICVTIVAVCVLPQVFRPGTWWGQSDAPWAQRPDPFLGRGPGAPGALANPYAQDLQATARGRIVDVKPGELRGTSGGAGTWQSWLAWPQGPRSTEWSGGSSSGSGSGLFSAGSWQTQVPAAYSLPAAGLGPAAGSFVQWPAPASVPQGLGLQGLGLQGLQGLQGLGSAGALPSEGEVTETYATFGVELQQWTPALAGVIDREVVEALLRELETSDLTWQQELAARGWRLTADGPRLAAPSLGPAAQELSVFDRFLPKPFADNPQAVDMWNRRQQLEQFLVHPNFEAASQRPYVLERLRDWRQRGLSNAMRLDWRPSSHLPTDGHILENLVVRMLSTYVREFPDCFMGNGHAPPVAKHLGQSTTAYLKQVTDQTVFPKPPPHYEVVTLQRTWKVRPGNGSILEALALLLNALRRQSPKSYQSFPQALKTAIDAASTSSVGTRFWPF